MIRISHPNKVLRGVVDLPHSKSISNRLLILKHLYFPELLIENLSEANDTLILQEILARESGEINVQDAGTVMRFLSAYYSSKNGEVVLKGSKRMHERPIAELVDALRLWGAEIEYLGETGFPPLRIKGGTLQASSLDMRNVKSSQFISALLMIMPQIGDDAKLIVDRTMNSWSFVLLTIEIMQSLGMQVKIDGDVISTHVNKKTVDRVAVERDWTSFYYFLSMAVLSKESELFFPDLHLASFQSELSVLNMLKLDCIQLKEQEKGLLLIKKDSDCKFGNQLNLKDFPDLAPSLAIMLAAMKQNCAFSGLESLQFKESDRDKAIASHLDLLGASWTYANGQWKLHSKEFHLNADTVFPSFSDHRMLMSAAPLALIDKIILEDPEEVNKSFPSFWNQMRSLGFVIEELA